MTDAKPASHTPEYGEHTPLPWTQRTLMLIGANGDIAVHCGHSGGRHLGPESEANARLIKKSVNFTAGYEIPADASLREFLVFVELFAMAHGNLKWSDPAVKVRWDELSGGRPHENQDTAEFLAELAGNLVQQFHPTADDSTDTGDA